MSEMFVYKRRYFLAFKRMPNIRSTIFALKCSCICSERVYKCARIHMSLHTRMSVVCVSVCKCIHIFLWMNCNIIIIYIPILSLITVKKCAANQVFRYKALTCQPSCSNRSPNCSTYAEGCVCKSGFILSGRDCVSESECGCYGKNLYMKVSIKGTNATVIIFII